jgi:hypothetical protein
LARKPTAAPDGWRNWQAYKAGEPEHGWVEYVLYSDSAFVDEVRDVDWPYRVVNLVGGAASRVRAGSHHPALALQVAHHMDFGARDYEVPDKPRPGSYHGGWIDDELAALLGLRLGVRLMSGGFWRVFGFGDDNPRGEPHVFRFRPPNLVPPTIAERSVLPYVAQDQVQLGPVRAWLQKYSGLGAKRPRALVRAARMHQRGLWTADADPAAAWLWFVGALEAAAVAWTPRSASARVRIAEAWPELDVALARANKPVADELTRLLAPQVRISWRVRAFVEAMKPIPPSRRPSTGRADWDHLGQAIDAVYDHRSKALHQGIPIPEPLCSPPYLEESGLAAESPFGLATHVGDASWPASSLPMHLWAFEHLVRDCLVRWAVR